jgi:hypothetical protein
MDPENEDVVTFLPDGKYFAIRRREFSETLLYKHFHLTNFEEFLELIRGWGFARVNGNSNDDDNDNSTSNNDTGCGNCNSNESTTSGHSSNSNSKAAIHVFRHPHFKRNHPVDLLKIRFGSKRHSHRAVDTARVLSIAPIATNAGLVAVHQAQPNQGPAIEKNMSDDISAASVKRRLSPSHVERDSKEVLLKEQRIGSTLVDTTTSPILATVSASVDACDPPQSRRSSIELRGVAQAIATNKLNLPNGEVGEDGDDCERFQEIYQLRHRHQAKTDDRRSSASSLVDGGVEAATHTIVTDAIETLLFDERHTRETYLKHEKELSISSLPGVVPISKQLFAGGSLAACTGAAATAAIAHGINTTANIATTAVASFPSSANEKESTKNVFSTYRLQTATTYGDLEAATQVQREGLSTPRRNTDDKTCNDPRLEASPSRMEAAAALVSQSRQTWKEVAQSAPFNTGDRTNHSV